MSGRLEGKTAIVTGSTKGTGLGIARAYVREGVRVVINSGSAADSAGVARELGPAAVPVPADLSRSDEVRHLAAEARAALGRVDILVNNAGQPRVAPSESLPEADYRYIPDLNLNGCFLLPQEIVQGMLAAGSGVITHVSSMNGRVPFPQRLAYCVSKAGLNMMTKVRQGALSCWIYDMRKGGKGQGRAGTTQLECNQGTRAPGLSG